MRAADVMTPDPVSISPDASITDAIRLMLERKFSGLPVVDGRGALVGIITEGDLVRRTETGTQRKRWGWIEFLMGPGRLAAEYLQTASRKVGDVMTADVRTVQENSRLDEIVHLMERHQINRVLVVRDGKLVGIVTRANLLHALASVIAEAKPGTDQRCVDSRAPLRGTQGSAMGPCRSHQCRGPQWGRAPFGHAAG